MSSSASTVLAFPLTLREYFWVIARRPPYAQRPFLSGPAMCRCAPMPLHPLAPRLFLKLRHGNTIRGVELLRRELVLCQRLHSCEQISHVALHNIPRDEHDAAVAVLIRPGFELDRRMGEVLDILHHHRTAAAGDVENAFHAQQVGAAQADQG